MSDIVDRLRHPMMIVVGISGSGAGQAGLCEDKVRADMIEAAGEIELLRAQLADLRRACGAVMLESGLTFGEIKAQAR